MRQPITNDTAGGGTRRELLAGAGLAGLAGVVTACGGSENGTAPASPARTGQSTGSPAPPSPLETPSPSPTKKPQGTRLAKASTIPVGGGRVFASRKVVVTQPEKGEFRAFSAVCTHRGCTVGSVSGSTINCPCHGSKYSIEDASVQAAPATRQLARRGVTVNGGEIYLT
ncbi:Rieske (2Fe-2S) protein [Actinomadura rudentiformis]|uniref:Cytochrome bc1 complex Rieske iron-sulfur subunit n=1 Tax=Actinomadura rudentiformis TaxID=359158 RepID=A0A6H9YNU5_9ACTN|nr:Rieske (2Fe-2S) protein [Actinomadura rudentiformis]KAB2348815.1 Rieske 2Fe-2S domain-containing protein [Actinomadura rudentiformis]